LTLGNSSKPNPNSKSLAEIVSSPSGIIALVIVLVGTILIGWLSNFIVEQISKKLDKEIEGYRRGQDGEDKVVQLIIQALDGNWSLFRNINLPGQNKGDLDLVLIGPPGVWVLEVKNFSGMNRNTGETWEYKKNKQWRKMAASPSRQAFKNALRLSNFLQADNLKVFINAVVIWANDESPLDVENPTTSVWRCQQLQDELGNIWQDEKLAKDKRDKIIEKLTKLCKE
jgi:hypothetical protein